MDVLIFQQASAFPPDCTETYENRLSPVTEAVALRKETEPLGQQVFTVHWGSLQVCSVTFPLAAVG